MERIVFVAVLVALTTGSTLGYIAGRWIPPAFSHTSTVEAHTSSQTATEVPAEEFVSESRVGFAGDGEDILDTIFQDKLASRRRLALGRYCDSLDAAGVRNALANLGGGRSQDVWEARSRLMSRWAELEPEAAAQFALTAADNHIRWGSLHAVIQVWVHHDAEAAKKFILGQQNTDILSSLAHTLTMELAARDPADALRFVDAVPLALKPQAIRAAFWVIAGQNPTGALAQAARQPTVELREMATSAALSAWVLRDPEATLAWINQKESTEEENYERLEEVVRTWQDMDSEAAASYVQRLPAGSKRQKLIALMVWSWGAKDPEASLRWIQSLPDDLTKSGAIVGLVNHWSSLDPLAAADFIARQPTGESTDRILRSLGSTWTKSDPEGALSWALAHPTPEVEKHILSTALGRVAADDPMRAVAALEHLQSPEARKQAAKDIAHHWFQRNPNEAMQWVVSLPDSNVLKGAIRNWTSEDPIAVGNWLNSLQNDPRRDSMVATYASSLQYYDPEAAANWANTLKNPDERQRLLSSTVKEMAQYDPAAANAWIKGQRFNAAELALLRKQVDAATKAK